MNTDNSLSRYLSAQQSSYPLTLEELRNGRKTTHWMWFIFPQIDGLGNSSTAKYYAIKSIKEAKEYVLHPVLGKRLLECSNILLNIDSKTADEIFGYPDNLKLKSSMTLFSFIATEENVFSKVLRKYFAGGQDERTISILAALKH